MPKSSNKMYSRGDYTRTRYCPFCDKHYIGNFKTVDKLVELHIKKQHPELKGFVNFQDKQNPVPDATVSDNFYSKKNNQKRARIFEAKKAEAQAALGCKNLNMTVSQYKEYRGTPNHKKELEVLTSLLQIQQVNSAFNIVDENIIDKQIKKFNEFIIAEATGILMR